MTDNKHPKLLKIVLLSLVAILLLGGILVGLDYKSYKDGNRSRFFGTLSNYNQNQTLEFGNLNLKVSSVSVKAYPQPTDIIKDCSTVGTPSTFNSQGKLSVGSLSYQFCNSANQTTQDEIDHYKAADNLVVNITFENVSNKPLSLNSYSAKLVANTQLKDVPNFDYKNAVPNCSGLPKLELLKGSLQHGCFSSDLPKGYRGQLILQVDSGSKQKIINLTI